MATKKKNQLLKKYIPVESVEKSLQRKVTYVPLLHWKNSCL